VPFSTGIKYNSRALKAAFYQKNFGTLTSQQEMAVKDAVGVKHKKANTNKEDKLRLDYIVRNRPVMDTPFLPVRK
jgi:hypothetical protein